MYDSNTVGALFAARPCVGAVLIDQPAAAYFGLAAMQGLIGQRQSHGYNVLAELLRDFFRGELS